jgi:PAS domain S-box-containing protein
MYKPIIVGLLQNTAILLAISMIYDYWWIKDDGNRNLVNKIFTGLVIGIIGIILMLTPWILIPGISFDTRSVVLSVSGLFFGPIPTIISMVIMGIFRFTLGGDGVWMGIAVIISSGTIGLFWNKFRSLKNSKRYILELVFMGFLVHIVMLGCTFFLPKGQEINTLKIITLPVLIVYPLATVLLGILMFRHFNNWQNRKAAEKLSESERRFSAMLKNTSLYSIIIDSEARIIFCNQSLLSASGFSKEELIGKYSFNIFVEEESRDKINSVFRQILEGDRSQLSYESYTLFKDGSKVLVSWNSNVLADENGTITGIASIGENITKKKLAEKELIEAKLKAEESDQLKSIFLANMSHEIRTPMNSIMGFSSLLGEKDINDSEKGLYIEIIKSSGTRLLQLINDIIDLSKLEGKQLKIKPAECNLSELLINSTESFKKSELIFKKPNIDLILNIPENLKKIVFLTDCNRIQQVLDNLISNAIKYTDNGKIEIGCSVKSEDVTEIIEFFVKDSGAGIPNDMSNLIFERFRQIEENGFHEGAGLGLSISKGIIELLGGKIWFESEINKGSTFYFTIPYIIPKTQSFNTVKTMEGLTSMSGKNIIIAEDDYNSFRYLQLLLNNQKANLKHAKNGKDLLDMVHESVPDLILLDINMPVMSGFEFLSEIQPLNLKMKIIAQTAFAMPDEKEKCLKAGCHGYISKPINKTELFKVINSVLSDITD